MLAGQNPVHSKLQGAREALIIMLEKFFLYNHLCAMIEVITLDKWWAGVLGWQTVQQNAHHRHSRATSR